MSNMYARTLGDYPLSVGTSATLSAVQQQPETPMDWLFNLRTLARNFVESFEDVEQHKLPLSMITGDFQNELLQLRQLVNELVPHIRLRIYAPTYASIKRVYPHAIHKEPHTEKQKGLATLYRGLMASVDRLPNIESMDCKLPAITKTSYITTHYVSDLLARTGFGELILVESHTGTLKRKHQWSTKLTGGDRPEVANLPFTKMTLGTFGDQAVQFNSGPVKIKRMLLDLAKQGQWNPLTTEDRTRFGVNQLRDPFAKRFLLDMFR
ncbi:hypothetical protein [Salmonella enterica]|uniref:hypothetical protein n=1 Tax=Salmonella enterica TaxID=28901 RepID=UPI0018D71678|nr:hypothetical protein [Salmonella enterica]